MQKDVKPMKSATQWQLRKTVRNNINYQTRSLCKVIHPKSQLFKKGADKNGLVSGKSVCTSSKTEISNKIGI